MLNKQKFIIFLGSTGLILLVFLPFFGGSVKTVLQSSISFPISGNREPLQVIKAIATAYSSDFYQTDSDPCLPADGYDLCEHYEKYGEGNTIAANFLPFGTQVKIPELFGDKVFIVHDRMNSKYGYGRIDVWMPTRAEAVVFGVKSVEMHIYGGGEWHIASK